MASHASAAACHSARDSGRPGRFGWCCRRGGPQRRRLEPQGGGGSSVPARHARAGRGSASRTSRAASAWPSARVRSASASRTTRCDDGRRALLDRLRPRRLARPLRGELVTPRGSSTAGDSGRAAAERPFPQRRGQVRRRQRVGGRPRRSGQRLRRRRLRPRRPAPISTSPRRAGRAALERGRRDVHRRRGGGRSDAFGWYAGPRSGTSTATAGPTCSSPATRTSTPSRARRRVPEHLPGVRDLLFLNEGRRTGTSRSARSVSRPVSRSAKFAYGLGALFSDLDRDGDLDLYVANDTNPNRLYENVPWPGGAAADPAGLGFRFEERAAARASPTQRRHGRRRRRLRRRRAKRPVRHERPAAGARRVPQPAARTPRTLLRATRGPTSRRLRRARQGGACRGPTSISTPTSTSCVANGAIPVTDLTKDAEPTPGRSTTGPRTARRASRTSSAAVGLDAVAAARQPRQRGRRLRQRRRRRRRADSIGGPLVLLENTRRDGQLARGRRSTASIPAPRSPRAPRRPGAAPASCRRGAAISRRRTPGCTSGSATRREVRRARRALARRRGDADSADVAPQPTGSW